MEVGQFLLGAGSLALQLISSACLTELVVDLQDILQGLTVHSGTDLTAATHSELIVLKTCDRSAWLGKLELFL